MPRAWYRWRVLEDGRGRKAATQRRWACWALQAEKSVGSILEMLGERGPARAAGGVRGGDSSLAESAVGFCLAGQSR